ncbi:serine/threonine-protein kinase ATM isoform X4 [Trifolium pratense]|uniref:serine/threonine-protein kinase ATM isoform X4 n=1 Tax=Trifolium pratense TaxID=57577 RepID=UPI001E695F0A|nr:serine/threonine-protein kinase ATM isoform X4 [Trifolium pratense]
MAKISSRDVREIVENLSSEKVKPREEGIKLLNSWLEGERSYNFCKFIGLSTSKLRPDEVPHSETWPFLVSLVIKASSLEISSSKRRNPKMIYAKTLRLIVQRAEAAKYSGKILPLSSVVKPLFNHVWDVLSNVPSFQSEYGIILRHLLAVRDYSFQMRKRVYCSLVMLYIEKVEASLNGKNISHFTSKEEVFRNILTLHSLLDYPPRDYPVNLREDIVKGFVKICSFIREEGKISRKLVECINTYLLNDGPNLGFQLLEIHNAMQEFMFQCWLTTHDRVLKDSLMVYARTQLNLIRGADDRQLLVEHLLDVIYKDLDQGSVSSTTMPRVDGNTDDKLGTLSSSQCGLVELAAVLFYRACLNTTRASLSEKRVKREPAAVVLREALMKGKWLWNAAFCYLTRNFHTRICKDLFLYWFEGIWMSFDRILNSANVDRAYDGLLWTLRSLQELSSALLLPNSMMKISSMPPSTLNEFMNGWKVIWSTIVHGLPIFSNIATLVDAALALLSNITSNDLVDTCLIPQDVWDLQFFKRPTSIPILHFFSCYFSRKKSHTDLRDILHLRKNFLKAVLNHHDWKGYSKLSERMGLYLPSAMFALCVGFVTFTEFFKEIGLVHISFDVTESLDNSHKVEDPKHQCLQQFLDCSVEVLTEIHKVSNAEVSALQIFPGIRVPQEISDQLLLEMETSILEVLEQEENNETDIPDIFLKCSLLSNLLYGYFFTRKKNVSFCLKLSQYLQVMVDKAASIIKKDSSHGASCLSYVPTCEDTGSLAASVRCFLSSPIFCEWRDQNLDFVPFGKVITSVETLLKEFVNLYDGYSQHLTSLQSDMIMQNTASTDSLQSSRSYDISKSRIVDMELDVNDDSRDVDSLLVKKIGSGVSSSVENWKVGMISLISFFFSASPKLTWDTLYKLMEKESDPKVRGQILHHLCEHPHCVDKYSTRLIDLVNVMSGIITEQVGLKLACGNVLSSTHALLSKLFSLDAVGKEKCGPYLSEVTTKQCFESLGNLVHKLSKIDLDWFGRVKLIDCIFNLISLHPQFCQTMTDENKTIIDRLLLMLNDMDYRVRLSFARRIGVLFQTWDGHDELFQDLCSNFGVPLVVYSKGKTINAKEVLAAGPQPRPIMETVLITLMHVALHSEKVELEAVFMICVVSAIDPCQRELVCAVLDNLSKELKYTTRMKYLEELFGSLLFCWVACSVSLAALVETRHLFIPDAEPGNFLQYCCRWLLPALLLHQNSSDLNWVAKVTCQPVTVLIKHHFASIFSISMALHCSKKPGSEGGTRVLQSSILELGQITVKERDELIKRHLVSIVSCILSLCSCSSDPVVPFFSMDAVSSVIQTVVDGFLDSDGSHTTAAVVDKINIFRPDRVFMFLVEIHYKITAASHYRHKCHRLSGIEVLISVLGQRVTVLSTSNYLFNLIGPLIGCPALQVQCCRILSALLKSCKEHLSADITSMLGEQLQFLVSKLVACCIPSERKESLDSFISKALPLLRTFTLESDPSMHDYVKELEPFPELKIFDEIRKFHEELCHTYSIRDHILKFVKRSCYLPPRLLLSSLQALHKKLLIEETFQRRGRAGHLEDKYWHGDHEIVHAVWTLVHMCGSDDASGARELVSDFISRVGAGDPHSVVFQLPGKSTRIHPCKSIDYCSTGETSYNIGVCISEEFLVVLIKLLMKYLMDDSVKVVDTASQTLRGILSTERGQKALHSFDSYQRSLVMIHSKGVNIELVENLLSDLRERSKVEAISLEKSTVWLTDGKSFEPWICPLAYSLIVYCNDVILRLCQDMILLKAEAAELLLPCIFVNISARKDLEIDLHQLISLQLKENIFVESNKMIKSIQVILNCLNELRVCYVMEKSSLVPSRHEVSKNSRPPNYSSKSRSTPAKARQRQSALVSSGMAESPSSWEKVYWLSIDYLHVAKAAVSCGSYFTSVMYVEHWCEEQFNAMTIGGPYFSDKEMLPDHIEILVSAVTRINEPDSLYGILQCHKLTSQAITFEHEGNWGKALEYYDLQVQSGVLLPMDSSSRSLSLEQTGQAKSSYFASAVEMRQDRAYKGLVRSLQQIGCTHVLDMYCQGLTSSKEELWHDREFAELQYESAWRAGNWDFSLPCVGTSFPSTQNIKYDQFNENLHSCLRALQEGDVSDFQRKLRDSKQELVWTVSHASEESTEFIYLTIIRLQMLYHLGMAWDLRWRTCQDDSRKFSLQKRNVSLEAVIPSIEQVFFVYGPFMAREFFIARILWLPLIHITNPGNYLVIVAVVFRHGLYIPSDYLLSLILMLCTICIVKQLSWLDMDWFSILQRTQLHMNLLEPFIPFRRVLLQTLSCRDSMLQHLLQSATTLRKGARFSQAAGALHEFKSLCVGTEEQCLSLYWLGRIEEAKLFRAQGQNEMAINLGIYISKENKTNEETSDIYRLIGKWLAETRSSNSRTILEQYLKPAVSIAEDVKTADKKAMERRCQTHFHLAHYTDALFRSHEERLNSNEWQSAMRLRKHKTVELEALIKRFRSSTKGEKTDYTMKIQELQKQLAMDKEEDQKLQVFRIVSLWFSLSSRKHVVNSMLSTIDEVQSFKFIPLVYQIASRMGSSKDGQGPLNFQFALVSLVKKMAIDHPYHTVLQLLALANGDRIKDKQRSRSSFVVDMDKKHAAENLLNELSSYHGAIIQQMKQMVDIYIRLAEMETKKEDTNKRVTLPRDLRNLPVLELVPVVTATISIDRSCQYHEGTFPYFKGLADSVMIMNGINAPKVVECLGSDGCRYRQLAKSGNDDLRQDAVMEQFFGLVNTFLRNHQDTWRRRLGVRTYKVVPFTPSAGVLEWVNGTLPLGEYLLGSMRNGGAHGRYGVGDWSFFECREHMTKERDKSKAFQEVCEKFRPVMHFFFLERFLHPAEWFEKRLAYTRSVAASSMVGYIVGLGDRHSMNILIDQTTAEVVHIDLGVAFEQGLMLKTPERVPFRLTRDVIDGMGVTGVEGVFRRCCEKTLSVMQTNKEALLTIVEVFIHDPLYKWALSPLKALQRQKEMDVDLDTSLEEPENQYEGNKDAARALLRVKQKLDGYEDGEMRSTHGQVQQLIQDAIDSERLCQMYPGWGAWL